MIITSLFCMCMHISGVPCAQNKKKRMIDMKFCVSCEKGGRVATSE